MKTISAMQLRKKLGSVLDGVARGGRPVAVARGRHPLVVLVPYEAYRSGNGDGDRLRRISGAFQRLDEWRARYGHKLKDFDPVRAVRAVRDSR